MLIDITDAAKIEGWMTEIELRWLADQASKCDRMVEVGSWKGRSTLAIAKHTSGVVYCVDAWLSMLGASNESSVSRYAAAKAFEEFQTSLSDYIFVERVRIIRARSLQGAQLLAAGSSFDWVFLDGDHSYETVKFEIQAYTPLLKVGGLMSGHDYYHGGVWQAVHEVYENDEIAVQPSTTIWTHVKKTNDEHK